MDTDSTNSESSLESFRVSDNAVAGVAAEDVRPSAVPITDAAKQGALPIRTIEYELVDINVRKHISRFGTTTSLKSFSASVDMLDSDAPNGTVSIRRCSSSDVVCLG